MTKYVFDLKGLNPEEEEVLLKALRAVIEVILRPEYYSVSKLRKNSKLGGK